MSKKIKNKMLVNGKVFRPAKLNEEWVKEPARDESLKEIYNDDYFISLIPEGCKYFAIDEKNEKIYGLGFNYKEKMEKQITDLEAKLAESEKKFKASKDAMKFQNEEQKEWMDKYFDTAIKLEKANKQLAEKEQTIEEINKEFVQAVKDWKSLVEQKEEEIEKITKVVAYRDDMDRSTTINGVKFTNEQIITLQNIDYFADKHNQDKISFAVEQLEKVRSFAYNTFKEFGCFDETDLEHILDNQIEEIKKENV